MRRLGDHFTPLVVTSFENLQRAHPFGPFLRDFNATGAPRTANVAGTAAAAPPPGDGRGGPDRVFNCLETVMPLRRNAYAVAPER